MKQESKSKNHLLMKFVWLSHIINEKTPLYNGEKGIRINSDKSITAGDSCNVSKIQIPAHTGTHVDAPYHFIQNGRSLDQFEAESWIFDSPLVLNISIEPGQLVNEHDLPTLQTNNTTDLILFHSGFERFRHQDIYWQKGPGIAPELAQILDTNYPNLRAVGMDFISISTLKHREAGRKAHSEFLERDILLIEDMKLSNLKPDSNLAKVIALPMRFENADGAPCTVVGEVVE